MIPRRPLLKFALCLVLVPMAATMVGCNSALVGTWKAEQMPEGERFVIQSMTFKDDGTYEGAAKESEQTIRLAGTYDYNGFNLKTKTPGKPERVYGATVVMGRTLEIRSGDKKQTLKKQ